jgi:hypothetical protein
MAIKYNLSQLISSVRITNISDTVSTSIIRDWCDGEAITAYTYKHC